MKTETTLTAERSNLVAQAEALVAKAQSEERDLGKEEQALFNELEGQVGGLDVELGRTRKIMAWKAASAKPAPGQGHAERDDKPKEKGVGFARLLRSLAACKGNHHQAAEYAEKQIGDLTVAKALSASIATAGGFLVPEQFSTEIIELLRPMSVVRASGARTVPMPGGNLTLPKVTSGATATWVGENTNTPKSEQAIGQVKLTARKLVALVPISNDLLRFASTGVDAMVRDDLVATLATAEDLAFLRDQGLGAAPKGLRFQAAAANILSANAVVNLQNVKNDLGRIELALEEANTPMRTPGYIFAPRTKTFLQNILDANGNPAFPEINQGRLRSFPYKTSTQVPKNLAPGTASEIYVADFSEVLIGEAVRLTIDASSEAAYHDGVGVVSAWSLDQTTIRVVMEVDLAVRHDTSVAILKDVLWIP